MTDPMLIVGSGVTGFSVAKFFSSQQQTFYVLDTLKENTELDKFKSLSGFLGYYHGELRENMLSSVEYIFLSPGVDPQVFQATYPNVHSDQLVNDVEWFCRLNTKPIIAITGSNGKTTVTLMLEHVFQQVGIHAVACGNVGKPVLDVLQNEDVDCYILELSSYQLELLHALRAKIAVVLNISEDHLERHGSLEAYKKAKLRIYDRCELALINKDEMSGLQVGERCVYFTEEPPTDGEYGISSQDQCLCLGKEPILKTDQLSLLGQHNHINSLVVAAIVHEYGVAFDKLVPAILSFRGLEHRCEIVAEEKGVLWVNDSKATNVAATMAAVSGFRPKATNKLYLVLGGQSKTDDLADFAEKVEPEVDHVLLFGKSKGMFQEVFQHMLPVNVFDCLQDVVQFAIREVVEGDVVLFSPACASFDMFKNYIDRGNCFKQLVQEVIHE